MYNNPVIPSVVATGGGALAATGFNSIWLVLAVFAMIAMGAALLRIVPRSTEGNIDPNHWRSSRSGDDAKSVVASNITGWEAMSRAVDEILGDKS